MVGCDTSEVVVVAEVGDLLQETVGGYCVEHNLPGQMRLVKAVHNVVAYDEQNEVVVVLGAVVVLALETAVVH